MSYIRMGEDCVQRDRSDSGQTTAIVVVFIVAVLGFAAVVMDGGSYLLQRRNLQGSADAAAMAAIREIPASGSPETTAEDYILTHNSGDGVTASGINVDVGADSVDVTVSKGGGGEFLELFGRDAPEISATASASVHLLTGGTGMLPMAFMRNSYTLDAQTNIKTDNTHTGNRGLIKPDNSPPTCNKSTGASDWEHLVQGSDHGGVDSCAYAIDSITLKTETGNKAGRTDEAFDGRLAGNTDSFNDVFEFDPSVDSYVVKKPDSPRLAWVPVIEALDGSTTWPNGASTTVRIKFFIFVYIGDRGNAPTYPAYGDHGKEIYVTPVRAVMPQELQDQDLADYDQATADQGAGIVFTLDR